MENSPVPLPTLHRVLVGTTMAVILIATGLGVTGNVPLAMFGEIGTPQFIGQTFAVVEVAMLGAAVIILGRRVPRRTRDQSVDDYWATVGRRATLLWFVIESTASIGAVAFVLTGQTAPILVAVAALVALVRLSPARFANPA